MSFDFPKNWKQVVLEDALDALIDYRGKTPKKVDKGIPLITAKVVKSGRILPMDEFIADEDYESWMVRGIPQISDIVVTTEAPLGEVAQIKNANVALAQRIVTLRGKVDFLENDFLLFLMQSDFVQNQLEARATGSTVKGIKQSELRKIILPIPPIVEQKCIGKILSDLDDKIHLNNQINQTLESIAQAIFKSWFIDFDPVRAKITAKQERKDPELAAMCIVSGKSEAELQQIPEEDFAELQATAALFPDEFVESELGEVPKEWEVKPLDKIANYLNGLALQKFRPENEYDFLPIVKIAQLKSGVATIEEKASPNIDRKFIIENGDVIFSWSGSLMVDIWCGGKAALNQHLFKVTSNDYHKWLYYFYTKHHLAEFQRIAQAKAVTMGHIKREHLSQALCCIASNQLLEISNIFIGHFLQKLIELRLENNNLKQLRDTLLPKLLSGEVEVENL